MSSLPPQPQIFVIIESMPPLCRPCHVKRFRGALVLWCEPTAPRVDVALWITDHLSHAERNALRDALGQPPIGQPMTDDFLDGTMATLKVPGEISLGPEWERRHDRQGA